MTRPKRQPESADGLQKTRSVRAIRASIAAAERWAHEVDRSSATAPARQALRQRDERKVDPQGILPPDEVARRVTLLRRARAKRAALKRWYG
jgi:hypothetical protein